MRVCGLSCVVVLFEGLVSWQRVSVACFPPNNTFKDVERSLPRGWLLFPPTHELLLLAATLLQLQRGELRRLNLSEHSHRQVNPHGRTPPRATHAQGGPAPLSRPNPASAHTLAPMHHILCCCATEVQPLATTTPSLGSGTATPFSACMVPPERRPEYKHDRPPAHPRHRLRPLAPAAAAARRTPPRTARSSPTERAAHDRAARLILPAAWDAPGRPGLPALQVRDSPGDQRYRHRLAPGFSLHRLRPALSGQSGA